jgi:hypothetical protein
MMSKKIIAAIAMFAVMKSSFATDYLTSPQNSEEISSAVVAGQAATISHDAAGGTTKTMVSKSGKHVAIYFDSKKRLLSLTNKTIVAEFWYDSANAKVPVAITYTHILSGGQKTLAIDGRKSLIINDNEYGEQEDPDYWEPIIEWNFYFDMDSWAAKDCSIGACKESCGDAGMGAGLACGAIGAGVGAVATPMVGVAVGTACGVGAWAVWLKCKDNCKARCK